MNLNVDKSTWKRVSFGDVVRNVNATVRDFEATGVDRIIAMEHMDPGELKISRWGSTEDGTTFTRRVNPGQTLFGKRRAYQRKVAYAEFDAICSGDIYTFEADGSQMLGELLPFLVQSDPFFEHALGTSAGSLSPRTNWRDLANFEFDLPPLDEQKRIADLLWAIERHADVLKQKSERSREAARTWVDEHLALVDERRPLADGVSSSAYGPRFSNSLYSEDADYRLLRTTDMDSWGNVDYATMPRAELDAAYDAHLLQDRDFLISRSGTCGVPAVFDAARGGAKVIPGAFLIRLRLNDRLNPDYLRAFFNSSQGREVTAALAQGGVQKNIRGSALLECSVPFPTATGQQALLESLAQFSGATQQIDGELSALSALRASILNELFGGN